jgi:hypothetical protein
VTAGDYARQLEAYLCKKNDGHLVRIAGPAFEQVCGWAARGVPLKVAYEGIDRYFERYYRKGPRRRPVRIEFCEADVLDVFDAWRRAVGVPLVDAAKPQEDTGEEGTRRRTGLQAHIDRILTRLVSLRGGPDVPAAFDAALADAVARLDAVRATAKGVRGEERTRILELLERVDRELLDAARATTPAEVSAALCREAEQELAPFSDRMTADAQRQAQDACVARLLRERLRLPEIRFV